MNEEFIFNVTALAETFLINSKKELEGIEELLLDIDKKDGAKDRISIKKEKLSDSLIEIISNSNGEISNIEVLYVNQDGEEKKINGITIS